MILYATCIPDSARMRNKTEQVMSKAPGDYTQPVFDSSVVVPTPANLGRNYPTLNVPDGDPTETAPLNVGEERKPEVSYPIVVVCRHECESISGGCIEEGALFNIRHPIRTGRAYKARPLHDGVLVEYRNMVKADLHNFS